MAGESSQERVGAGINLVEGYNGECSICLEEIGDGTQKGISKLQCGHVFHLSCIGVAFNARGEMVCPNCRNVEDNQWRYSPVRDDDDNGRQEQEQVQQQEEEGGDEDMDDEDVDGMMQIIAGARNNPFLAHMHHRLLGIQHVLHHHRHVNHVVISNNPNGDLSAHHHAAPVLPQSQQESSIRLLGIQIQQPSPVIRGFSENLLPVGVVPSSGINGGNAGNHSYGHSVEHPFYCPRHSLTNYVRQRNAVGVSLGFGSQLNVPAGYSYHSNSHATSFPPGGLFFPDDRISYINHQHPRHQLINLHPPTAAPAVLPNSPISLPTMAGACLRDSMFSNIGQLQTGLNQLNYRSYPTVQAAGTTFEPDRSIFSNFSQMMQNVNPVQQPPPPLYLPSSSTPPTLPPPPNHGTVGPASASGDCLGLHLNLSMDGGSLY